MSKRKLKIDKVKEIKRISRKEKVPGRGGPHKNKSEKRRQKRATKDYLNEYEEDLEELEENE